MKAKNLFFIVITFGLIQPIAPQSAQPMSKKEVVFKTAKIFFHIAQIAAPIIAINNRHTYYDQNTRNEIQTIHKKMPPAILSQNVLRAKRRTYSGIFLMISSFALGCYGLYEEFKSLVS